MATIDKIKIRRNGGVRPTDEAVYMGKYWIVEKGEPYDYVQFSIKEITENRKLNECYYWHTALCVKCGTSEEEINELVKDYAETITDEQVRGYRSFLEDGEKWGWD